MACVGDCWELMGPPPNSIAFMPPPPLPTFMQQSASLADYLLPTIVINGTQSRCAVARLCDGWLGNNDSNSARSISSSATVEIVPADGSKYDVGTLPVNGLDETWVLVLIASSIGVLFLGALLAMFLLKCREINIFGSNDCSLHAHDASVHGIHQLTHPTNHRSHHHHGRAGKTGRPDCLGNTTAPAHGGGGDLIGNAHPHVPRGGGKMDSSVLYHHMGGNVGLMQQQAAMDNRMVWAALTPRGTQHFFSETYVPAQKYRDAPQEEDHYETIDGLVANNFHAKDYEYEDPTPLIEHYPHSNASHQPPVNHAYSSSTLSSNNPQHEYSLYGGGGGNADMRCASSLLPNGNGTMKMMLTGNNHRDSIMGGTESGTSTIRPRVSEPTRIEHPNLPPLNLFPMHMQTMPSHQSASSATGLGDRVALGGTFRTLKRNNESLNEGTPASFYRNIELSGKAC